MKNNYGTVCAVIAAYNRKNLLSKCLNSLKQHSEFLDAICLVDNASDDGTPNLLDDEGYITELPPIDSTEIWKTSSNIHTKTGKIIKFNYLRNIYNNGSAGGFHDGIKEAYNQGYQWIWILDDDAIIKNDSLKMLLEKTEVSEDVGFLCSKVLWCDKNVHIMNIPQIQPLVRDIPFNKFDNNNISVVRAASWLSLLINREAVKKVGFPLKEFFVWGDDIEYTNRMTENNFLGLYVSDSIVFHATKKNYSFNLLSDDVENVLKYSFGIRNNLFIIKKQSKILFILYLFYNLTLSNFNILRYRKDNKLKFFWVNTVSSLNSILFRPGKD